MYAPSLQSAVAYADNGMVEEWVLSNLLFTHDKPDLYEKLMAETKMYFGVAKLPIRLIQTSQLPARTATTTCLSVNDYDNDYDYDNSPLIVSYEDGAFTMLIDESRILNLKQRKINAYPAIILMKRSEDHKRFMVNYGRHLIFESQGN